MANIEVASTTQRSTGLAHLEEFETSLLTALDAVGLPSEGVLVDIEERFRVFENYPNILKLLTARQLGQSMYLSKLLAAVGAGLFDAALNYLWDETIAELRRRVALYDLAYFFDIAVTSPDRRKGLHTKEDLHKIPDQDLIRAARELGLISDIGYQQLDLIRYMRNYASAAHPNQNEIQAYQLMGWIETCIKEVITLPENQLVADTKQLLHNVRRGTINSANAVSTASFFDELPQESADNIASGLFGIYIDRTSDEHARDGVRLLMPAIWDHISEDKRRDLGLTCGKYVANGDTEKSDLSRELLEVVNGAAYLPTEIRTTDIASAIDELLVAHRGYNNFHTESGPARRLNTLSSEPVPKAIRRTYVRAIVEVFLTNGNGIAWAADNHYSEMISRFGPREARIALESLFEAEIASKLQFVSTQEKYEELLDALEPKMTKPRTRDLFEAIRSFTSGPSNVAKDSNLRRLRDRIK